MASSKKGNSNNHITRITLEDLPEPDKETTRRLLAMRDEDIDYSDIPELDENFWKNAKVVMPKKKKAISLRVDSEVLDYFKSQGNGYQSLMNAVLRTYMEAHRK